MGSEIARLPVPVEAFDVHGDPERLRLFVTTPFVTDVGVEQPAGGGSVIVALYGREAVWAETGDRLVLDGAYLTIDQIAVRLAAPLGGRSVIDHGTGRAVPALAQASARSPYGRDLAEAARRDPPSWSLWGPSA